MELSPLKILLVSSDKEMAQRVNDLLLCAAKEVAVTVAPTADAGLALVATNNFHAILFEIGQANAAALFQITSLTTKAPQQAVIVIGPTEDENFLAEAVFSGAQDYLGRDQLQAPTLRRVSRNASRWSRKRKITTACSIISWKASSARRPAAITF